ncbi:STAS domain-containing protein [Streptomyces chengbuensis]|uniref:STAS domain-containing protein n=1 Tax=Streptomyces TaxID=1883 RepID=UPI0025B44D27|nr:STAS domain-containing protein [Streptomyces sp. HUAS CB01]WJY54127.1 STAS domain-containing protein [Streptomyces sp. HUAS CB01]
MAEHEYERGFGPWGAGTAAAAAPAAPPLPFSTDSYPGGCGRLVMVIRGELDHDTAPALRRALQEALARSRSGLEIDLRAVPFLDCSGLNVLLRLRREAQAHGKSLELGPRSPAVTRLLALSGTASLFPRPQ